ncbi:MAG TPA: hypothetical protein PKY95_04835 [candidate division Zixibacteria bacterium]|nr:hypothetical protein [candidate division Zixibacteria bacterium]
MLMDTLRLTARWALPALAVIVAGCSKSVDVEDEETDGTPPLAVANLAVMASTSQSAVLRWTTPADRRDDQSPGAIAAYDLRFSFDSITDENFAAAVPVEPVPAPLPAGHVQQWTVFGLTPDSGHYFALKSRDRRGNWSAVSNCPWVHCAAVRPAAFADGALEQAVRSHIHKPSGDILTSDIDTIGQLVVRDAGIASLAGLEDCRSLAAVDFARNDITSLAPLSGLPLLSGLYLAENNVSDLNPLAGMASLRQIQLQDNPVSDLGPLATIDSLQQLILWGTPVTDFSALYELRFLSDVGFDRMNLADISFMSHLKRPQICGLAFNNITSLEPLRPLYMLESLNLMQNHITDLAGLTPLTGLRELNLANNQIVDLLPLIYNTGLDSGDVIRLEGNPLSDYARAIQIPTLRLRKVTVIF